MLYCFAVHMERTTWCGEVQVVLSYCVDCGCFHSRLPACALRAYYAVAHFKLSFSFLSGPTMNTERQVRGSPSASLSSGSIMPYATAMARLGSEKGAAVVQYTMAQAGK